MPAVDLIKTGGVFVYDGSDQDHHRTSRKAELEFTPMDTKHVRGVEFPAGEPVEVHDIELAHKLRGMSGFEEVGKLPETEPAAEGGKKKRSRKASAKAPETEPAAEG